MKVKISEALKKEYKNLGLSASVFDGVAEFLTQTITEESAIDEGVKNQHVVSLLKAMQGDGDKLRQELSKTKKELEGLKVDKQGKEDPTQPTQVDGALGKVLEALNSIGDRLGKLEQEKTHNSLEEALRSALKGKNVPDEIASVFLVGRTLKGDENIEELAEMLTKQYQEMSNDIADKRFDGSTPPHAGGGKPKTEMQIMLDSVEKSNKELKSKK